MPVDLDDELYISDKDVEIIHNAGAALLTVEAKVEEGFNWDHSLPSAKCISYDSASNHQQRRKPQHRRSRPTHISVVMKIEKFKQWIKLKHVGSGMPYQIDENIGYKSPFKDTRLQKGDFLIHLGDESNWALKSKSAFQARLQGEISRGVVHFPMVFETQDGDPEVAEAIVYKETKSSRVGLVFMNLSGQLQIKTISPKGLLGTRSSLREGDNVEFINGIPVSEVQAEAARDMLKDMVGKVSIRVRSPPTPNPSMNRLHLSTPVRSPSKDRELDIEMGVTLADEVQLEAPSNIQPMFIGIRSTDQCSNLQTLERVIMYHVPDDSSGDDYNNDDKYLNVSFVSKRGPFVDAFPLEVGDVVRHRYRSFETNETYRVLKRPTGTPGVVCAVARIPRHSNTPVKLGLLFRADQGLPLRIGRVQDSGLFSESLLASGDTVISMNGVPCHYMTPEEAVALSQSFSTEYLTIMVRTRENRVIVIEGQSPISASQCAFFAVVLVIAAIAGVAVSQS